MFSDDSGPLLLDVKSACRAYSRFFSSAGLLSSRSSRAVSTSAAFRRAWLSVLGGLRKPSGWEGLDGGRESGRMGEGRARGAARGPVSRSGMSGTRASPAAPGFGTSFWKVGCGRSLTRMLGLTWYRHLPFAGDWSEPSEGIRGLGPACALSGRSLGLGLCPLSPCPVLSHCDRNINAR